jgi:hypothetical protein
MASKQEQIEAEHIEDAYEVKRQFKAVAYWHAPGNFCEEASQTTLKFWANLSSWTLTEAASLTINRDPKQLIEPAVGKGFLEGDSNVDRYHYVQEHIKRAVQAGELTDPVQPAIYVAWAKTRDLDFPEALTKLVPAAVKADNQNTPHKEPKKPADKNHTALMRERNMLLKLFFCAAVDGYGYDPKAERSPTAKEMESAFECLGIRVSDDTIRKYLNEAKEELPADFLVD